LDRAAGWAWRLLVCAAAAGVILFLLWYLKVIVLPAIIALTIAPALTPLADRVRRLGLKRGAPGIALGIGILVVAGLVSLVTVSVAREYDELAVTVRQGLNDVTDWLEGPPLNLSLEGDRSLGQSIRDSWDQTSGYLVSGVRSGLSVITGLVLAVALLYFILRDGRALWRGIVALVPPGSRASVDSAGQRAWEVLGGYVRGTALIAAIDATLIGLGLWILGVPLVFALSVLIFLGAFIPFVGATISGIVAVLVALADGGVTTALIALAIVLGVQFLEGNFLQPIIQSRTVDLHPAIILLAVAAGGALFGIVGAYLAVPITAVAVAVLTSLRTDAPDVVLPGANDDH
jgi:predicted PurR-regulated permease PerM